MWSVQEDTGVRRLIWVSKARKAGAQPGSRE
jgi:hypothetical protein